MKDRGPDEQVGKNNLEEAKLIQGEENSNKKLQLISLVMWEDIATKEQGEVVRKKNSQRTKISAPEN